MSTHTEETKEMTIETVRSKLNKIYLRLVYGKSDIEKTKQEVDELLTLYASQVREKWLREEIVKLEGMKYIQVVDDDVTEAMNDTIQTIIDRHQAELTTLTPKT